MVLTREESHVRKNYFLTEFIFCGQVTLRLDPFQNFQWAKPKLCLLTAINSLDCVHSSGHEAQQAWQNKNGSNILMIVFKMARLSKQLSIVRLSDLCLTRDICLMKQRKTYQQDRMLQWPTTEAVAWLEHFEGKQGGQQWQHPRSS